MAAVSSVPTSPPCTLLAQIQFHSASLLWVKWLIFRLKQEAPTFLPRKRTKGMSSKWRDLWFNKDRGLRKGPNVWFQVHHIQENQGTCQCGWNFQVPFCSPLGLGCLFAIVNACNSKPLSAQPQRIISYWKVLPSSHRALCLFSLSAHLPLKRDCIYISLCRRTGLGCAAWGCTWLQGKCMCLVCLFSYRREALSHSNCQSWPDRVRAQLLEQLLTSLELAFLRALRLNKPLRVRNGLPFPSKRITLHPEG